MNNDNFWAIFSSIKAPQTIWNSSRIQAPLFDLEFELADNGGLNCHQTKFGNFSTIEHWPGQATPHLFHLIKGFKRNANRFVDLIWIGKDILEIRKSNFLASRVLQNRTKSVSTGVRMLCLYVDTLCVRPVLDSVEPPS